MKGLSLITLAILIIVCYPFMRDGFRAVKYYYEFYELRAQLAQLAKVAPTLYEQETEARLRELLRDFHNVKREHISFEWSPKKVIFKASWSMPWHVDFYGYPLFQEELVFEIHEETPE
ncbi:MAG: hypothetical protein NZT61_06440 [Deltaproteobacteria bacterium]|nr:hypothetical protein [Deltaproteobacteria bacterium]MCX7953103.1 hypothetical protein [Deltaproteobacteria bacterium]